MRWELKKRDFEFPNGKHQGLIFEFSSLRGLINNILIVSNFRGNEFVQIIIWNEYSGGLKVWIEWICENVLLGYNISDNRKKIFVRQFLYNLMKLELINLINVIFWTDQVCLIYKFMSLLGMICFESTILKTHVFEFGKSISKKIC